AHPDHEDDAPGKNVPVPESEAERQFALVSALELDEMQAGLDSVGMTRCLSGDAAGYACDGVDLISFIPLSTLGGGSGNDLWGWTHERSGREFAIMGRTTGVTFVEITNPKNPKIIGTLPSHSFASIWRDLKVYNNHVFIVSEAQQSGLQVFDLRQLLSQKQIPHVFSETAHLAGWSNAHNIALNEATGYAYVVGANTCGGGLHMVDVSNPTAPVSAGCFSADGYTHDVQCVVYDGVDADHIGSEICFASNEDTLTIVDVSNKALPVQIARKEYSGVGYSHQGWLTDDHRYFVSDDELDELNGAPATKTYVWDISDLDNPVVDFTFAGATAAIDHNQYIRDDRSYQANYKAGLRVVSLDNIDSGSLAEVAYFDTFPQSNGAQFDGAWTSYPFYRANVVAVSTMDRGLFILGYEGESGSVRVGDLENTSEAAFPNRWRARGTIEVHDESGQPVAGAKVKVRWSNGKTRNCTTDATGSCEVKVLRGNRFNKVWLRVVDIDSGQASYASWLNEDSDGDSNGFRDKVTRP
ncbi:MAG: choice-of-anchor B family protein, partial [Acidimicrobiia bacterium]|nr:choice-of-anchor B family protein [Acidimicrobiia bacterium]